MKFIAPQQQTDYDRETFTREVHLNLILLNEKLVSKCLFGHIALK